MREDTTALFDPLHLVHGTSSALESRQHYVSARMATDRCKQRRRQRLRGTASSGQRLAGERTRASIPHANFPGQSDRVLSPPKVVRESTAAPRGFRPANDTPKTATDVIPKNFLFPDTRVLRFRGHAPFWRGPIPGDDARGDLGVGSLRY